MLKRLTADNYLCLDGFEIELGPVALLLGANGSGKSAVLGLLQKLVGFLVLEFPAGVIFPPSTRTRWREESKQLFCADIETEGGTYHYRLSVEHEREKRLSWVEAESLFLDSVPLFEFAAGELSLRRDDGSLWSTYPASELRSAMAAIPQRNDLAKLEKFRNWWRRCNCVHIDPFYAKPRTHGGESVLVQMARNFPAWYQHHSQEDPGGAQDLERSLSDVLEGFEHLTLEKESERTWLLQVDFRAPGADPGEAAPQFSVAYDEISEGQRCLVVLYAILAFAAKGGALLAIDEPDNFVALREIQPWLLELLDRAREGRCQAIVVSHHPETLDHLAVDFGLHFDRPDGGPTRVRRYLEIHDSNSVLSPSETISRGWEDAAAE